MQLKFILESVLFSAQKPLSPAELRDVLAHTAEQAEDETARAFKKVKLDDLWQLIWHANYVPPAKRPGLP